LLPLRIAFRDSEKRHGMLCQTSESPTSDGVVICSHRDLHSLTHTCPGTAYLPDLLHMRRHDLPSKSSAGEQITGGAREGH